MVRTNRRRVAYYQANATSRQFLTAWPSAECKFNNAEFAITVARYYGVPCPACAPHVGQRIRCPSNPAVHLKELDE